jgi:hypothetical protein
VGLAWASLGAGHCLLGEHEEARAHGENGIRMLEKAGIPPFTALRSQGRNDGWAISMRARARSRMGLPKRYAVPYSVTT